MDFVEAPRSNNLGNFAGHSGRVAALLVVAIARYDSSSRPSAGPLSRIPLWPPNSASYSRAAPYLLAVSQIRQRGRLLKPCRCS
jgi:hypothetical protein